MLFWGVILSFRPCKIRGGSLCDIIVLWTVGGFGGEGCVFSRVLKMVMLQVCFLLMKDVRQTMIGENYVGRGFWVVRFVCVTC